MRMFNLFDRLIQGKRQDLFEFKERIVYKIYSFLDETVQPITLL